MKVVYVKNQTIQRQDSLWKKLEKYWNLFCNTIEIEERQGKKYYLVPNVKKEKRKQKVAQKVQKLLQKEKCHTLVLSKECEENKILKNVLYANQNTILEGRWLFHLLIFKIINWILRKIGKEEKEVEITLLMNEYNEYNQYLIQHFARTVKRVEIVTGHIQKFKKMETELYEQEGIMIMISNNKRRSLLKSEIIINLDFPEEKIDSFRINPKAILINVAEKIKIKDKSFQGITINDYQIKWQGKEIPEEGEFKENIFYESMLWDKENIEECLEEIQKDKVEIMGVIGNNGPIAETEWKK